MSQKYPGAGDIIVELDCSPDCGLSESQVIVELSENYNRKLLDDLAEKSIGLNEEKLQQAWKDELRMKPFLWNGTKFRFHSFHLHPHHSSEFSVINDDTIHLKLNLGVTDFATLIATNYNEKIRELKDLGKQQQGDQHAYLSDPIGVSGIVQTSDDKVILCRRSSRCVDEVGDLDFPGGHAEPEELVGKDVPASSINFSALDSSKVVHELFDSILREVRDEVGIPLKDLSQPLLVGINRHPTGRPTFVFLIQCSLPSTEVESIYLRGEHPEKEESTEIVFLALTDIPKFYQEHVKSDTGYGISIVVQAVFNQNLKFKLTKNNQQLIKNN